MPTGGGPGTTGSRHSDRPLLEKPLPAAARRRVTADDWPRQPAAWNVQTAHLMRRGPVFLASVVLLIGCGGPFATDPGDSVMVPSVTRVQLASTAGGFGQQTPQGAPCTPGVWSFTVGFDNHHLGAT